MRLPEARALSQICVSTLGLLVFLGRPLPVRLLRSSAAHLDGLDPGLVWWPVRSLLWHSVWGEGRLVHWQVQRHSLRNRSDQKG